MIDYILTLFLLFTINTNFNFKKTFILCCENRPAINSLSGQSLSLCKNYGNRKAVSLSFRQSSFFDSQIFFSKWNFLFLDFFFLSDQSWLMISRAWFSGPNQNPGTSSRTITNQRSGQPLFRNTNQSWLSRIFYKGLFVFSGFLSESSGRSPVESTV